MTDNDKKPNTTQQSIEDGIGVRLKLARESKGLSQVELHKLTGISRTVIQNYETGRHKPGTRELRLICDAIQVSPNQLIYGTEVPYAISNSLSGLLLKDPEATAMAGAVIFPFISIALGVDDSRNILNLIESILKAKNPQGYTALMDLIVTMTDSTSKLSSGVSNLSSEDQEKMQNKMKTFLDKEL